MAKQRFIAEKAADRASENDLRRLAKWNDAQYTYGEPQDWASKSKEDIIEYLRCQFIISTSWVK